MEQSLGVVQKAGQSKLWGEYLEEIGKETDQLKLNNSFVVAKVISEVLGGYMVL